MSTIAGLAEFLNIPKEKTSKAVFMVAKIPNGETSTEKFIFAILRGDMNLNETKLANAIGASELRPAHDEEIEAIGAVPGYASPIRLKEVEPRPYSYPVVTVVDDLIPESNNLVAGANQEGYHLVNVNYGRDYQADIITDIAAAGEGERCPNCGEAMRSVRGVEVGNIFKLGTHYSESMGCYFLDKNGTEKPVVMGSYGIGSGRLLACIAEEYNDEYGLIWPITVAPYQVHLVALSGAAGEPSPEADRLYGELKRAGIEVLYDDRDESPGVKFNDADLIGIPIRLTVSKRSLKQGGVEFKRRDSKQKSIVAAQDVLQTVNDEIATLTAEIMVNVVPEPYDG
jgi:prolyl-tRNA synthetase